MFIYSQQNFIVTSRNKDIISFKKTGVSNPMDSGFLQLSNINYF